MRKVRMNGQEVMAKPVDAKILSEDFNKYLLPDGRILKTRWVLM